MACAKLHTFTGAGTFVQPQTPHQISRDSSITQMWTLLVWELLCLPRPAWLCPQPPCTLCMHTDSGSVVSALASGHKPHSSPSSPCLLPLSLVQQPSLVSWVPMTPRLHILLQPPGAQGHGNEGRAQCFMGHLVLDALCPMAPQSLHFTCGRKGQRSVHPLKCQ